jgi:hypothetical protein
MLIALGFIPKLPRFLCIEEKCKNRADSNVLWQFNQGMNFCKGSVSLASSGIDIIFRVNRHQV